MLRERTRVREENRGVTNPGFFLQTINELEDDAITLRCIATNASCHHLCLKVLARMNFNVKGAMNDAFLPVKGSDVGEREHSALEQNTIYSIVSKAMILQANFEDCCRS